jgi:hypothetical protein
VIDAFNSCVTVGRLGPAEKPCHNVTSHGHP